jgi:hypothetical protein
LSALIVAAHHRTHPLALLEQQFGDGPPDRADAIEGVLEGVREHLEACPCCSMQLNLVLDTLKAMED